MPTKQQILAEIKRTAQENGGKPLGAQRLQKETGIGTYDWRKYWARLSDAHQEAGVDPNQFTPGYDEEFLIEKLIGLIQSLGKFPTLPEINLAKNNDPELPNVTTFQSRLGSKAKMAGKVVAYCQARTGYDDVIRLSTAVQDDNDVAPPPTIADTDNRFGEVYLFKSGRYYKIGMTKDMVRRGNELKIQLPERMDLIHSITTDDPSGIEAYWHKRFEAKRMNGEWFDLNSADIRAFKRWKRIY
jgi:hypothetical protein